MPYGPKYQKVHRLWDVLLHVPELQLFRYSGRDQRELRRALQVSRRLPVRGLHTRWATATTRVPASSPDPARDCCTSLCISTNSSG